MKEINSKSMMMFSPALGLIFGSAIGFIAGILTNNNLAITAGIGAGLGLVIAAIIYAYVFKEKE